MNKCICIKNFDRNNKRKYIKGIKYNYYKNVESYIVVCNDRLSFMFDRRCRGDYYGNFDDYFINMEEYRNSKGKRTQAMEWWNKLNSSEKTNICDTHTEMISHIRRWESLTGSEIEKLYVKIKPIIK